MFYNHDILTDRKHGVATIWLVATLGSKSSLRKVTRKAILDVDVPSACDTITDPSAPLALRLQGSLLFGVSRVFSQQCGYVLTDMQNLRDKMRGITMLLKELEVDPDVVTTRPEQLNLQIDPGFNIDLDLGFDLSGFNLNYSSTDEPSSLLSPRTSASSRTSFHDDEFGLGEAPPLDAFSPQGRVEDLNFDDDDYGDQQVGQRAVQPQDLLLDQTAAIVADDSFEIQEDGEIVFPLNRVLDDRAQEETDNVSAPDPNIDDVDLGLDLGDFSIEPPDQQDDGHDVVHNAEDHPMTMDQALQSSSPTARPPDIDDIFESVEQDVEEGEEPDAETMVVARAAPQRNRAARVIPIDNPAELQNSTLGEWDTRYLQVMEDAHKEHANKISVAQAKRNAAYWILDQGIGGVSADFREDSEEHPLAIFSGEALLEMFDRPQAQIAGRKRSSSVRVGDEDRRVRPRTADDDRLVIADDQIDFQPGVDDGEQAAALDNDDEVPEPEIGRQQEAPLSDGPEQFPWNSNYIASSHHGSRQGSARPPMSVAGVSSSVRGLAQFDFMPSSLGSRRISRLIQESPLDRRRLLRNSSAPGSATYAGTEFDNTFGEDDLGLSLNLDETIQLDEQLAGDLQDADFEVYGPAAPALASTQQAADSQWLAATLEQEAYNFLTFVSTAIAGKDINGEQEPIVTFEELLPPDRNSHVVAAQGLLHVLSLATKGLIEVLQEEPFGSIEMGVNQLEASSEVEAI